MDPGNPILYQFNKEHFHQLAEIIISEYLAIQEPEGSDHLSLTQMLLMVLATKDRIHHNERLNWQEDLKELAERAHHSCYKHYHHAEQNEIDRVVEDVPTMKLAILTRLIDLKNQKHSQLEELTKKYNELLAFANSLLENKKRVEAEKKLLDDQNNQYKITITRMNIQKQKLTNLISKQESSLKTFQMESNRIRTMFSETKQVITRTYMQMQEKFNQLVQQMVNRYTVYIGQLKTSLISLYKEKQRMENKLKGEKESSNRTIEQLITDLSAVTDFKKKENQVGQVQLQNYRSWKGKRGQLARHDKGRPGVEEQLWATETDKFIAEQREKLKNFNRNLGRTSQK